MKWRTLPPMGASTDAYAAASPGSYIKHIIVIVQENRSFENIFAGGRAPMRRCTATSTPVSALNCTR
jgi:phospholipase C